jgi:DNA-binding LacI/PurR family transcriptional regulator
VKVNDVPLYREIFDDIKRDIENGGFNPGDKILTELEIADKYSVSRITATRAVKQLEQAGYISRARRRGSIVNTPDSYKAVNGQSSFISLILPFEVSNCLAIVDGAQNNAILNNYTLSVYNSSRDEDIERSIIESLLEMDAAGYIVWPADPYSNMEIYSKLAINKKPIVFLDFPKAGITAPCISADNKTAMFEMTNYVIENGHTNIAFYGTSLKNLPTESERYKGYISALIKNGITPKREYFLEIHNTPDGEYLLNHDDSANFDYNKMKARQSLVYLMSLETPPTAVICVNDICATHVVREALKMSIAVPDTLSVTGFDNLDICNYLQAPITTVQQDFKDMGKIAVELIMQMKKGINAKNNYLIATELVKRKSVVNIGVTEAGK